MPGKISGVNLADTHKHSGISLHTPTYIEILSPISMQCTMDLDMGVSYSGLNDDNNEHNNSQID